jgi:hypothetical protein
MGSIMKNHFAVSFALGLLLSNAIPAFADTETETITITRTDKLEWRDYPGLPGVKFVVIAGNPRLSRHGAGAWSASSGRSEARYTSSRSPGESGHKPSIHPSKGVPRGLLLRRCSAKF